MKDQKKLDVITNDVLKKAFLVAAQGSQGSQGSVGFRV